MQMLKALVIFTAAIMLSAGLSGCSRRPSAPAAPPEVSFITASYSSAALEEELSGRVRAALTAEVRPQSSGIIKERLFEEGAYVQAGQILYRLEDAPYRAAYDRAAADYEYSKVSVESARLKDARFTRLVQENAIAAQELDEVRFASRQAAASMNEKQAALEAAATALSYTLVRAPISGRIGISAVTAGALVSTAQQEPLAVIHDAADVFVDIPQPLERMQALRKALESKQLAAGSAKVWLILSDGSRYEHPGELLFKEAVTDESSGSVTLRARFSNPEGELIPGMFVKAVLAEAVDQKALLLPQSCVLHDAAGKAYVLTVNSEEKIERRDVSLGQTVGGRWQITGGLQEGDKIVSSGLNRVRPGDSVKAREQTAGKE